MQHNVDAALNQQYKTVYRVAQNFICDALQACRFSCRVSTEASVRTVVATARTLTADRVRAVAHTVNSCSCALVHVLARVEEGRRLVMGSLSFIDLARLKACSTALWRWVRDHTRGFGYVLCLGGRVDPKLTTRRAQALCLDTLWWRPYDAINLQMPREKHTVIHAGSNVVIVGGLEGTTHHDDGQPVVTRSGGLRTCSAVAVIEVLKAERLSTTQWHERTFDPDLSFPDDSGIASTGREVIILGGVDHSGSETCSVISLLVGNLDASSSSALQCNSMAHGVAHSSEMLECRKGPACCVLQNGCILVVGGARSRDIVLERGGPNVSRISALASCEIWSPVTRQWRSVASMRGPRAYATAVALPCGRVIVLGGCTYTTQRHSGDVQRRRPLRTVPTEDTWMPMAAMLVRRMRASAVYVNRCLVVFGSSQCGKKLIEMFCIDENCWHIVDRADNQAPQYEHTAAVHLT